MTRPLTIKEIQEKKKAERSKEQDKTRIINLKSYQIVPIQIYGKNSKSSINQITVPIPPKGHVDIPTARLIVGQIDNLRKRGFITTNKVGIKNPGYKKFLSKSPVLNRKKNKKSTKKSSSKSKNS